MRPSGLKATPSPKSSWPRIGLPICVRVRTFQSRTVSSPLPETSIRPFGLKARLQIVFVCPRIGLPIGRRVRTSQSRIVRS